MKSFWVLIAVVIFVGVGQCAGKKRKTSRKVVKITKSKATKAGKPTKWVGPPFGLYEVNVFNMEWNRNENDEEVATLVCTESDFKWLRLYPNRTYKTNQSESGKPEGRFTYDLKKKEVTFYEYRPKSDLGNLGSNRFIADKFPVSYETINIYGEKGPFLIWGNGNSLHGGQVECKWVKP